MNAVAESIAAATRVVPLTEAVELNPRPDRAALSDELEVSFVPMAAVEADSGRLDVTAIRRFGEVKKGYTIFREGDVLFAKITPCMENGKMAVARGLRNDIGCGSTEFHVLRPRPGVDAQYVYHFVSSARFRAEAAHHMTGAVGQKRVSAAFLEQCEIPLPDLDEQRRIVAELEKQFSRLDEALAGLKRVEASLKCYKAAVLNAAVEGRLVPPDTQVFHGEAGELEDIDKLATTTFRNYSSHRNEGAAASEVLRPLGLSSPLPRHWTTAVIGDLAELVDYGSSSKTGDAQDGIPVLRMGNIIDGELDLTSLKYLPESSTEFPKLLLKSGDMLFNRTNSPELVGKTAVYSGRPDKCSFASYLIRIRFSSQMSPEFVSAFINSTYGRAWVKAVVTQQVGQANVNGTKLKNLRIPVPPAGEQLLITRELQRYASIVRHIQTIVDRGFTKIDRCKAALLDRAFLSAL